MQKRVVMVVRLHSLRTYLFSYLCGINTPFGVLLILQHNSRRV